MAVGFALMKRAIGGSTAVGVLGYLIVSGGWAFELSAAAFAREIFIAPMLLLTIVAHHVLACCLYKNEVPDSYSTMATVLITLGCFYISASESLCVPPAEDHRALGYYSAVHAPILLITTVVSVYSANFVIKDGGRTSPGYQAYAKLYDFCLILSASLQLSLSLILSRMITHDVNLAPIAFIIVCLSLSGLGTIAWAFRIMRATVVIPQVIAFTMTISVIAGAAAFGEFKYFNAGQIVGFIAGQLLMIGGAMALVHHHNYELVPNHQDLA